ncbi:hypothetical protein D9757_010434 [Collybiopsis confluens]|uniref:Acetoin reductase family protein n=1 Tax=Collybiopsis confluens TaxID=2823264 RepID=A0A8H5GQ69_9AGAR|nr:hypothetical protein D9757_010434 [Collybiopsis confluens]
MFCPASFWPLFRLRGAIASAAFSVPVSPSCYCSDLPIFFTCSFHRLTLVPFTARILVRLTLPPSQNMSSTSESQGVALITGSSQGIGRAIAFRLARDGFDIALNDVSAKTGKLKETRKTIEEETGRRVIVCVADISAEEEVKGMVATVVKDLGGLDVMVANAGICPCGPLNDVTIDAWDHTFSINARGTFLCYKYASLQMIAQGRGGRIIGASSAAGKKGYELMGIYCSTKFAVRGLTQAAALEYGKHGITVNAYCPGAIDTDMSRKAAEELGGSGSSDAAFNAYKEKAAVGRFGSTDDVANLVSFFASKESGFVTGQSIIVDGGVCFD